MAVLATLSAKAHVTNMETILPKLTDKQKKVLDTIKDRDGYVTYIELSSLFGAETPSIGQHHARALEKKGYITRQGFRFLVVDK